VSSRAGEQPGSVSRAGEQPGSVSRAGEQPGSVSRAGEQPGWRAAGQRQPGWRAAGQRQPGWRAAGQRQPGSVSRAASAGLASSRRDQRKTRAMHASLYAGENRIWGKTEHLQGFATISDVAVDSLRQTCDLTGWLIADQPEMEYAQCPTSLGLFCTCWRLSLARLSFRFSCFGSSLANGSKTMIERLFFGSLFALWLADIGWLCAYEPQNVKLFLLCAEYTCLGLLRTVGLY
jgi:hypothetical protein